MKFLRKDGESVTLTLRDIYSRQIAIINVGMSTAYGIPGPLFKGGTFRFVPIPESHPTTRTPTYAELGLSKWVTDSEVGAHNDPEFITMTYGDYKFKEDGTRNIRVSNALKLQPKDFMFFFASLANKKYRRLGRTLGMFLIGFFEIRKILTFSEAKLSTLTKKNAHRKRKNDSNYTIWKGTNNSTLFKYAVPMSKGNADSYLRTSRGDHLPWGSKNKNGRTLTDLEVINSATRASRLIKLEFRKLFWNYIIEKNPNISSLQ